MRSFNSSLGASLLVILFAFFTFSLALPATETEFSSLSSSLNATTLSTNQIGHCYTTGVRSDRIFINERLSAICQSAFSGRFYTRNGGTRTSCYNTGLPLSSPQSYYFLVSNRGQSLGRTLDQNLCVQFMTEISNKCERGGDFIAAGGWEFILDPEARESCQDI